ncbi:MAG: hypothetical protein ABFD76_02155, partial [Smithella sp.]
KTIPRKSDINNHFDQKTAPYPVKQFLDSRQKHVGMTRSCKSSLSPPSTKGDNILWAVLLSPSFH